MENAIDIKLKELKKVLLENKFLISVAESCTGGLVSKTITDIPGSSNYFVGGVVTYQNTAKEKILNIPIDLINKFTAVSEPVDKEMAQSVRKLYCSDFSISTTGYAGPHLMNSNEPTGLVFIGISSKKGVKVYKEFFYGNRNQIRIKVTEKAIEYLINYINNEILERSFVCQKTL